MIEVVMEATVAWTIVGLEAMALAAIAGGFFWGAGKAIVPFARGEGGNRYILFRRALGRGTLIALELLVAVDILRSLVLEPSASNIALLAALVGIRTFLSFSIDVELDGCWPWQRARPPAAPKQEK